MKKMAAICALVLGTYAFSACDKKAENDETVVDRDVVVESDTTVRETVIETDTTTRTRDGGSSTDTLKK
jgi:hypothetical protein